jgi:hypothetical protein
VERLNSLEGKAYISLTLQNTGFNIQQDSVNIRLTLRRVRVTIVTVEKQ